MISSHNYIVRDSFDSWKIFDTIISHTYEYENHNLYVHLFLGTVLNLYNDDDDNDERPVKLIVYPSGLTITKEGEYIRKNKEFIKLHIIEVDAKSEKIISFRVTKGIVHAFKELGPIIRVTS